jgi:PAS domain S-box-containing protein
MAKRRLFPFDSPYVSPDAYESVIGNASESSRTNPFAGPAGPSHIQFLEAIKAAIIITDGAGIITYWNPSAEELYGWASNEVVGRSIMEITVSSETEQEARAHMADLNAGKSWSGEFEVRCKAGGFLTALVTLSPLLDESGSTIGIVGVSQDLSGRKQAEEELRNAREELEKRVQERTAELALSNESLQTLSGQLIRAQDDERRRIARELHDSTGQVLSALAMTLSQMQRDSSPANLHRFQECREMITSATAEIRNLSYLLHPPLIDEVGLASAVAHYAEGFEKRSGLKVQVEISREFGRLDKNRELTLFRILQESLGNIQRHSGSDVASIRIFCAGDDIVMEIRDQGRGLPGGARDTMNFGVGIRSMRERLRPFGGVLQIESGSTGTNVRAVLPRQSSSGLTSSATA